MASSLPTTAVLTQELFQLRKRMDTLQFRINKAKRLALANAREPPGTAPTLRTSLAQPVTEKRTVEELEARLEGLKRTHHSLKRLMSLVYHATRPQAVQTPQPAEPQQAAVEEPTANMETAVIDVQPLSTTAPVVEDTNDESTESEPTKDKLAAPLADDTLLVEQQPIPASPLRLSKDNTDDHTPLESSPFDSNVKTLARKQPASEALSARLVSYVCLQATRYTNQLFDVAHAAVSFYWYARMLILPAL